MSNDIPQDALAVAAEAWEKTETPFEQIADTVSRHFVQALFAA
jgi:hypothetical protein